MLPVFVLCSGRCGSTYLTELLKHNGIDARHEPEPDGWDEHVARARDRPAPTSFLDERPLAHVEVNNRLALFTPELKKRFPEARFVHLHRDGRACVTSQVRNEVKRDLRDIYPGETEFEAACHWWEMSNRAVLDHAPRAWRLRFEEVIGADLAEVEAKVGVPVDRPLETKVNVTPDWKRNRFPSPDAWTSEHRETFWSICGDTMEELGYA